MTQFSLILLLTVICGGVAGAQDARPTSEDDGALARYLEEHPEADTDGDGVLTWWEKQQHIAGNALEEMVPGTRHFQAQVPMRDGYEILAEVFLPPRKGALPVVLCRAGYGRWRGAGYGRKHNRAGAAYVTMDVRKYGEGAEGYFSDPESSVVQINDMYDTCEWLVQQEWCNGRIGTVGGSGNAFASSMGFWCLHPAYKVCGAGLTAGNLKQYWAFQNGVAHMYSWLKHNGHTIDKLRPTLYHESYDYDAWLAYINERAGQSQNYYFNSVGWYDPLLQGALDDFSALQDTGRALVRIPPRGHGGVSGFGQERLEYPVHREPKRVLPRASFEDILSDKQEPLEHSVIQYFLMGDLRDPEAPGNQWVYATRWPPESRPTPLYLQPGGGLAGSKPPDGEVSYSYDPNDPAPHFGGHYSWRGDRSGPHDQRPLRRREDALYFETEPLEQPLNVTGRLRAQLHVSSTAKDTLFVVKLVDIYPDGYEAILREGAAMARYANGFDDPQPLEAGRVYALDVDLWSTAQVFNRGHKIALIVTSSAAGAEHHPFEIHPNTYEPIRIESMPTDAVVARNTLHMGAQHPSRVILPVVDQLEF